MEVHWLVALLAALWLHEARAAALDLDFALGFLLDELDIVATATDDLGSQVKAADRLQTYWDLLLGPLALLIVSNNQSCLEETYPTILIALELLRLATTEPAFIYEVREIFLHHLFDHLYSLVQAFLGGTSDPEIQRRALWWRSISLRLGEHLMRLTAALAMFLSG
jgi:hypothetical protein